MLAALALVLGAPTGVPVEETSAAAAPAHLLGADPATWTPGPVVLGADPATWSPKTDCDSIATKDTCDKSGCSWCLSGAVPPACKTKAEAKQLPGAVFQCDNIGA